VQDEKIYLGLGGCSSPIIPHNCIINVERLDASKIAPGDILVYCGYKALICHRVILRKKTNDFFWFLTKPDNSLVDDGWIPEYRVIGKVKSINNKPFCRTSFISLLLLFRAFSQYVIFNYIFLSHIGVMLRKIRSRYFCRPILSDFVLKITSPWLLIKNKN